MLRIECPSCAAAYDVPAETLGANGRKVRCSACQTLWLAKSQPDPAEAMADEPVVEAAEIMPPGEIESPVTDVQPPPVVAPVKRRRPWHERIGERMPTQRARWPYAAGLALVIGLGGLAGLRKTIVHHVPEAGRIYAALGLPVNLSGLDLRDVRSGIFSEGGVDLLVVQGEIANISATTRTLPRLKFSIRDTKGVEIYAWTAQTESRELKPGETQTFRRRLASPPPEGTEVLVRFATKSDLIALAR